MCPFNANQTCGWKRPASSCLLPLSGLMEDHEIWLWRGLGGEAVVVISGFEGINPHSLPLEWPRLTPCRPRHNKRAKGLKAERGEIKTEPATRTATTNLGFSFKDVQPQHPLWLNNGFSCFEFMPANVNLLQFLWYKDIFCCCVLEFSLPTRLKYFAFQSNSTSGTLSQI